MGVRRIATSRSCAFLVALVWTVGALSSQAAGQEEVDVSDAMIDRAPMVSARGGGMARALSTLADSNDALYHNPAGLGGANDSQNPPSKSWIRQFHFPWVGTALNADTLNFYQDLQAGGIAQSSEFAPAVIGSYAGRRQYARFSFFPNFGLGRSVIGPLVDEQVAVVPVESESDQVVLHERTTTGFVMGTGFADRQGRLYLGYTLMSLTRADTVGQFDFNDIAGPEGRDNIEAESKTTRSGLSHNVGLIWQIAEKMRPRLGVVIRDVANTSYTVSSGNGENESDPQDVTIGMSMSPRLGNFGSMSMILQGSRLTDADTATNKKVAIGWELLAPRFSGQSLFGLRLGYNLAGLSFGTHVDVGIVHVSVASEAHDVGLNNKHTVDRRYVLAACVNLGE